MSEKSVFPETSIPELTSQSFPVSCFCTPQEVKFHIFVTLKHGQGKSLSHLFCYSYRGDFIEQITVVWLCYSTKNDENVADN